LSSLTAFLNFLLNTFSFLYCAFAALLLTSERLGAAAAYTTVYAGDKRSITHCLFRGVSAAVAPNRQLAVSAFSNFFIIEFQFPLVNNFSTTTKIGLYIKLIKSLISFINMCLYDSINSARISCIYFFTVNFFF